MRFPDSLDTAEPPGQRLPVRTMMCLPGAARGFDTGNTISWSPSSASVGTLARFSAKVLPVHVITSPCSKPLSRSSRITIGMPPTLSRSAM